MSDNSNLTAAQAQTILDLCKTIKSSPEETTTIASRSLANEVEGIAAEAIRSSEAREAEMSAVTMMNQTGVYAESKVNEAIAIIDKATKAVAEAKECLATAQGKLRAYYMMKDVDASLANANAHKAILQAGLAILEVKFKKPGE